MSTNPMIARQLELFGGVSYPAARTPTEIGRKRQRRATGSGRHDNSASAYEAGSRALSRRAELVLNEIRVHGPLTDREVRDGLNPAWDMNAVRPRISELVHDGSLVEVGKRIDPVTRMPVRVVAIANRGI